MTKPNTSWKNTIKGFGRIATSKTLWFNVAIVVVVATVVTWLAI